MAPAPVRKSTALGPFFPDPAGTDSNPLRTHDYGANAPGSDQAPDGTKPPQLSTLNKGTYERLNGHHHELDRPIYPDPANTPSNPLSVADQQYPSTGEAPDGTKPPQVSTLNKGTYERLNSYQAPVAVNNDNPFSKGF
eukprot:Sro842_g209750.2  (138) ;mRNA; r:39181-39594